MVVDPEHLLTHIDRSIYCGTCGYNLRTLPMIGRCPECGGRYNAHGRRMKGIFVPQESVFPWTELFTAALSLLAAAGLIRILLVERAFKLDIAIYAAVCALLAALSVPLAWRKVSRYLCFRDIDRDDEPA